MSDLDVAADEFLQDVKWPEHASEMDKTLALFTVRSFVGFVNRRERARIESLTRALDDVNRQTHG